MAVGDVQIRPPVHAGGGIDQPAVGDVQPHARPLGPACVPASPTRGAAPPAGARAPARPARGRRAPTRRRTPPRLRCRRAARRRTAATHRTAPGPAPGAEPIAGGVIARRRQSPGGDGLGAQRQQDDDIGIAQPLVQRAEREHAELRQALGQQRRRRGHAQLGHAQCGERVDRERARPEWRTSPTSVTASRVRSGLAHRMARKSASAASGSAWTPSPAFRTRRPGAAA